MPAHPKTVKTVQSGPVTIGEAARRAGVSARMVRHYEALGLLPPVHRTDSGYRQYTQADVHALRFIRRGRDLGFSMEEIGTLLGLWQNQERASSQVKQIALRHVNVLQERIAAMQAMQRTLQSLVQCCHGDDRPDCPILDDLASADSDLTAPLMESMPPKGNARKKAADSCCR